MILTTHALIGAALGKNISNPWIVAAVAIPLHFLFDHFRHGEYLGRSSKLKNTWWKATLDMSGATIIVSAIIILSIKYFNHFSFAIAQSIAVGMFFSMLPDLMTLLYWEFHWPFLKKIHDFHVWCHRYHLSPKEREWTFRNTSNDIIFSVIAILLLLI